MPPEPAAVSAGSVYTMQPCITLRQVMQSHIRRVHACLAVTCHLHFWPNDQDLNVLLRQYGGGTDTEIRVSMFCSMFSGPVYQNTQLSGQNDYANVHGIARPAARRFAADNE